MGHIAGRIVTVDGRPVAETRVLAEQESKVFVEGRSSENGRFRLRRQGRDAGRPRVTAPGHHATDVRISDLPDRGGIVLRAAFKTPGIAVDAGSGQPVLVTDLGLCTVLRREDGTARLFG